MESQGSLPYSQVPATCPYPEPARSNPYSNIPLPEEPSQYYPTIYAWVSHVFSDHSAPTPVMCPSTSSGECSSRGCQYVSGVSSGIWLLSWLCLRYKTFSPSEQNQPIDMDVGYGLGWLSLILCVHVQSEVLLSRPFRNTVWHITMFSCCTTSLGLVSDFFTSPPHKRYKVGSLNLFRWCGCKRRPATDSNISIIKRTYQQKRRLKKIS
jgi:hypothetical protein